MGEYLSENTLSIFIFISSSVDYRVRLFDPNGETVYTKENQLNTKIAFTTSENGNHQICTENYGNEPFKVDFEFLTGIAAKDYSEVAKKSNLKPVELSLQKLEDMLTYLIKELTNVMSIEENAMAMNDSLSNKIILFSVLTLGSMIFVGLIETIYLKKFFHNKKIT